MEYQELAIEFIRKVNAYSINTTNLVVVKTLHMSDLVLLQETINKQSEKSSTLQVIVTVENEHLKHMVAKLDDKVREGKKAWLETNECSNTIALTKASEQKLGTMMQDVNEMRNVCTSSRGVMYMAVMLSLTHPLCM